MAPKTWFKTEHCIDETVIPVVGRLKITKNESSTRVHCHFNMKRNWKCEVIERAAAQDDILGERVEFCLFI